MNGPHIPLNSGREARSFGRGNDGPRDGGCWVQKRRRWFGGPVSVAVSRHGAHPRRSGALRNSSRDQRKADTRTLHGGPRIRHAGHSNGRLIIHGKTSKREKQAPAPTLHLERGESGSLLLRLQWACASV